MKKLGIFVALISMFSLTQCDVIEDVAGTVSQPSGGGDGKPALTNEEVIAGLKEALTIGIEKGASLASATDGFFKNPKIFIPWPDKAIESGQAGMGGKKDLLSWL